MEGLPERAGARTPSESVPSAPRTVLAINSSSSRVEAELSTLTVANRPVILRVLDRLAEAGIRDVAVAVEPRLAGRIRDVAESGPAWPFALSYFHRPIDEGLLDAVGVSGQTEPERPLLLHWGCGLFKAPLSSLLGGMAVDSLDAVLLVEPPNTETPVVDLAVERLAALGGRAGTVSSGRLAGLALLGAGAPEVARRLRPGRGGDADIVTLVEQMAELGGTVRLLPAGASWRYTGAADSALDLNRFLLSDLVTESPDPGFPETVLQGAVQLDPSATLERSTIRGPVIIGAGVRLFEAWIGPYTSIGEEVCVEGAEVENSILLKGARISHLDRRVEASVIGAGATICRDFRLPRALRLHVGDGARVSLT